MSYIGNTNTTQAFTPAIDYFSGNASTTAFTLSRPVASVAQVQAVISNVPQAPGTAFTVSGNTITFTSAPPSGTNNIYVYYTSPITQVIAPSQGTVGTTQLQNGLTVNFADGSAAAPSITNDGDTNTGIFFPAADTIAFAEGGVESMRIDSAGNVGIGTSSPFGRLHVESSAGGLPLYVNTTASAQNARIRLNSTDNASSVSYVLSYSHASLNKQASILLGGTGAIGFYTNQTAGSEPTSGILAASIDTSGNLQFNSGYGSVATAYGCRAWVNFNGTGTVAIRASGNISSITDNGTGDYTVNFTNAMPDANYAYHIGSKQDQSGLGDAAFPTNGTPTGATDGAAGMTTTRIRLRFTNFDATPATRDQEVACVSIFR